MAIEVHKFQNSTLVYKANFDADGGFLSVSLRQADINKTFLYSAVSKQTWEDFKVAKSAGSFYNQIIRRNHLALGEGKPLSDEPQDPFLTREDFSAVDPDLDAAIESVEAMYEQPEINFDAPDGLLFDAEPGVVYPGELQREPISGESLAPEEPMPPTTSALTISEGRIQILLNQALDYTEDAMALTIADNDTLQKAEELFKTGSDLRKILADEIQPVTRAHYETWKLYKDRENRILIPIQEGIDRLGKAIYRYRTDMERLAAIETQKQLDEAREAAKQEEPGRVIFVPRTVPVPPTTKGTRKRKKMVAVVDDFEKLVCAVADGVRNCDPAMPSVSCLEVHQATLNAAATAKGEEGDLYPGVRAIDDGNMAKTRTRREVNHEYKGDSLPS